LNSAPELTATEDEAYIISLIELRRIVDRRIEYLSRCVDRVPDLANARDVSEGSAGIHERPDWTGQNGKLSENWKFP
jgi:hypothetical protein